MATLLDTLRTLSTVDCDTLNAEVAAKFGPFADCTCNQAIAFAELSRVGNDGKPLYHQLMVEALQIAHWQFGKQTEATPEELAVELMMVSLALHMAPHTTGYVHVQTNPLFSYSTQKTVKNADRIMAHFKQLSPDFDTRRVCIKIPSTWEGLQACRELEKRGITTLATTLFSLEQTALAADAGCRYIAPYVNELRVHFDSSYKDPKPALPFCATAQTYLNAHPGNRTLVLAASLTSTEEVMQLAGVHHITLPPGLLAQLAATSAAGWSGASEIGRVFAMRTAGGGGAGTEPGTESGSGAGAGLSEASKKKLEAAVKDESAWRMAFTTADGGESERKLGQAINIFADVQEKLEELVRRVDGEVRGGV